MKIRCLIIDDEPLAIRVIESYLQPLKSVEIVAVCENVLDAYTILESKIIDLIFLDIQMPALTGLDFIRTLKNPPLIVLTTAYRDFAVESYELDVLDYLIKPIPFPRFMKAIQKVQDRLQSREETILSQKKESVFAKIPEIDLTVNHLSMPTPETFIFLKAEKKMIKVAFADILFIESLKDYIKVKTKTEELVVHQTLTAITDLLPSDRFLRIHRSFTIAIDKVKAVDGNCVEIGGKSLPIGRNFLHQVKERIYNKH